MTPMALTLSQKFASLFCSLSLHAPLLGASDKHGSVEHLRCGCWCGLLFECCDSHGISFGRISGEMHFSREGRGEQIANTTPRFLPPMRSTLDSERSQVHIGWRWRR